MRLPRAGRGTEIMPIVRDLLERGVTQQEIAHQAGTSRGHVRQAIGLLYDAPDLAEQVECGQTGLTTAHRTLCERRLRQLTVDGQASAISLVGVRCPTGSDSVSLLESS